MTTNTGKDGHTRPEGLRERWRSASVGSVWRRPSDWYHPAVDALARAVDAGADPTAASWELGRARGEHGVGIAEALDDVVCLYRSTGCTAPPLEAVRALTEGWSDAHAALATQGTCVEPESGLPTQQYLGVRLAEAYGEAERADVDAALLHRLVVVDVAAGHVSGLLRAARSAAAGAALREAFGSGHPMATLGGGVFAVLVRTTDDVDALVAELRAQVAVRCADVDVRVAVRQPVRVWVEPVPATHPEAVQRLGHLARPEPWQGVPRPAEPVDVWHADGPGGAHEVHPLGAPGSPLPPGLLGDLWPEGPPPCDARAPDPDDGPAPGRTNPPDGGDPRH